MVMESKKVKSIYSDVCDVMRAGLDCLWLECGISKYLYDTAKEFAELYSETPGGKLLLEWLNRVDVIERVDD